MLKLIDHQMQRIDSFEKTLMLGKIEGRQEEKGTTEDEMVGWHHRLNVHEFEQAPGVGDGQGSTARAASLRVRIWPECPERYLSEIIWASKPDCGISTT